VNESTMFDKPDTNRNARRCEVIDKEIARTLSDAERNELAVLEREANEDFDRIVPPPLDDAKRLLRQLLNRHAGRD